MPNFTRYLRGWGRRKPPVGYSINWSDPLARGLQQCWLLNEGAGNPHDIAASLNGTISGVSWIDGREEHALVSGGTTTYASTGVSNFNTASGTILWSLYPNFAFNDGTQYYFWGQTPGDTAPEFSCQRFSDNNLYIGWNTSSDRRVSIAASAANLTQSVWNDYAFTWGASGSKLYHNGQLIGSNVSAPATQALSQPMFLLATDITGSGKGCPVGTAMDYWLYLSRDLTPTEVLQLYQQPFCFMKQPAPVRPFAFTKGVNPGGFGFQPALFGNSRLIGGGCM